MKLPRRLLSVLLVAACVSPVPVLAGQTTVGLHGGLTRATFSDLDALVEQESRSGVRVGVSATVPVSGSLGLRFAGSYVQAGGGFAFPNFGEDGSSVRAGINLDYFRLSALARAALPMESSNVAVYLLAGPFAGFRTGCSTSIAEQGVSFSADCEADFEGDLSTTDFGISGGVGLEVGVSNSMGVALEALYDLGLTDIDLEDTKTRVFSIVAGLVFSL
ncbi:porin family protein [Candidatus Palauibacter sp.]|uniref:porin family protein n=1 Tax=Candidatus Palauibacter sp. TaxID=3101350 RepID=UPI003B01334A